MDALIVIKLVSFCFCVPYFVCWRFFSSSFCYLSCVLCFRIQLGPLCCPIRHPNDRKTASAPLFLALRTASSSHWKKLEKKEKKNGSSSGKEKRRHPSDKWEREKKRYEQENPKMKYLIVKTFFCYHKDDFILYSSIFIWCASLLCVCVRTMVLLGQK